MSIIKKTLLISSLIISGVYANSIDDKVLAFEKDRFSQNKRIKIIDISVNLKKELPIKDWYGYIVDVTAKVGEKELKAKDVVFSNGKVIAPELIDINTGDSLKDLMTPKLDAKYYDEKRLIAGSKDAKDKIVIFSDPLCPFCIDYVPEVIKYVKANPKKIALYYYHFPLLRIHPAADTLIRAMSVAEKKGLKDIVLRTYETDFEPYFDERSKDKKKILAGFNKEFKTNITLEEIANEEITKEIFADVSMGEEAMVEGTPTIYINGEADKTKLKYETLGK